MTGHAPDQEGVSWHWQTNMGMMGGLACLADNLLPPYRTKHLEISETQNSSINEFCVVQKRILRQENGKRAGREFLDSDMGSRAMTAGQNKK